MIPVNWYVAGYGIFMVRTPGDTGEYCGRFDGRNGLSTDLNTPRMDWLGNSDMLTGEQLSGSGTERFASPDVFEAVGLDCITQH